MTGRTRGAWPERQRIEPRQTTGFVQHPVGIVWASAGRPQILRIRLDTAFANGASKAVSVDIIVLESYQGSISVTHSSMLW